MAKQASATDIYRGCLRAGFSKNQSVRMTAVALAESGGDLYAKNSYVSNGRRYYVYGLWQASTIHGNDCRVNLLQIGVDAARGGSIAGGEAGRIAVSADKQAKVAKCIFDKSGGFGPWSSTYKKGTPSKPWSKLMDQARGASKDDASTAIPTPGDVAGGIGDFFNFVKENGWRVAAVVAGGLLILVAILIAAKADDKAMAVATKGMTGK